MWLEWLAKYWFEAACAAVLTCITAYVKHIVKDYRQEHAEQAVLKEAVLAELRIQIMNIYTEYTEKEYIPLWVLEVVEPAYQAYTDLGGNGLVPGFYKTLKRLPNNPPERSCGNSCLNTIIPPTT